MLYGYLPFSYFVFAQVIKNKVGLGRVESEGLIASAERSVRQRFTLLGHYRSPVYVLYVLYLLYVLCGCMYFIVLIECIVCSPDAAKERKPSLFSRLLGKRKDKRGLLSLHYALIYVCITYLSCT